MATRNNTCGQHNTQITTLKWHLDPLYLDTVRFLDMENGKASLI